LAASVAFAAILLLRAGTAPLDLIRYALYAVLAVMLPGTLVYRSLRGRPHTLVEDLSMGTAVGLALEIPAWALFSVLDLRGWAWLWPALVVVPYALVPRLRRHWLVRGYAPVPLGWSWSVAGVVCFFTAYLAIVFINRNPILPTSENTRQYLDLAYQLSLAGEAKNHIPLDVPQVAGEPLNYHWFGYAHMAMTSLVGHIDLPVVALRLAIPALCAAAVVGTAVVGWRISGRPYVGAVAAALFFAVGEFSFVDPVAFPFGTQATFVIWHGMSMIYSWVLLIALILPLAQIVRRSWPHSTEPHSTEPHSTEPHSTEPHSTEPHSTEPHSTVDSTLGAYVLAALLLFASSGAKASSLPVVGAALLLTAVLMLMVGRRIPWGVVGIGLVAGAAQLFAVAVLYAFHTYGSSFGPLQGLAPFWSDDQGRGPVAQSIVVIGVWIAFVLNMLLRYAGMAPLLAIRSGRSDPAAWLLVAGGLAGPGIYLLISQVAGGNQYFTRSGFAFGVIASAWGYVLLFERARLSVAAKAALGVGSAAFAVVLVWANLTFAGAPTGGGADAPLRPILSWAWKLTIIGVVVGIGWWFAGYRWRFLRGRGCLVALTAVLLAGAPGLIMDEGKSLRFPNGGAYAPITLPKSRVDAARWVRDHSAPNDVVATNVHCMGYFGTTCDPRSFWLSAYSERRVLVEGWSFAPRMALNGFGPFWDQAKLAVNDAAFTAPTAALLNDLRTKYGVRWLVVDRQVAAESPELARLADKVYDNRRLAVYAL
jgi:hypothetical protein